MISEAQLHSVATILLDQVKDDSAKPFYDMMSGAVVWAGEVVSGLTTGQLGCLRSLFRCRTNLILNEPDKKFDGIWEAFQEACPNWIGFLPERSGRDEQLVNMVRELKRKSDRRTAVLFRTTDKHR
jgi:hypothetical protein